MARDKKHKSRRSGDLEATANAESGTIKRITERVSPRVFRMVALPPADFIAAHVTRRHIPTPF